LVSLRAPYDLAPALVGLLISPMSPSTQQNSKPFSDSTFLRRKSKRVPITEVERKSYFTRLRREGLTAQAYLVRVNGLSHTQPRNLGLLHNGGFEIEPGNWGFDWHIPTDGSFQ